MADPTSVQAHYHRPDLYETVIKKLQEQGVDLAKVSRKDIAGVDEFHVRGAEVSMELAKSLDLRGKTLLDVGCGIGGPCRMLAEVYHCRVTGIDLNEEYIRTAEKLSQLVGLSGHTDFLQANATELPFEDHSFDVVWTQHVQMNIPDKHSFYQEISRVLNPGGNFLYYDIFKQGDVPIAYPVPWAEDDAISFLFPSEEMNRLLLDLGFRVLHTKDQTEKGIAFFEKLMKRIKEKGPPKIGINLLMGEKTPVKIGNLLSGLKEGKLQLQSGVYLKE